MSSVTGTAFRCGPTARDTKVSGVKIKLTGTASCIMQMVTYTKDNGSTIKHKALAAIHMQTVHIMKGSGSTISSTAEVLSPGPMEPSTKAPMSKERKKDAEN